MSLSLPREHSRLTKRKTNTFPPPGFQLSLALQCFPFPPGFPKSCTIPNYRAFLYSQCFPERTTQTSEAEAICPNPQRISEATPGSYLNKESIVSMASSTISTHLAHGSCSTDVISLDCRRSMDIRRSRHSLHFCFPALTD